jgi:retinol dehydrogenase 12
MTPATGLSKTAQGYELHLGINNIGTFMFTELLTPILVATAKNEPPNTLRVVWVSSHATEMFAHEPVGVPLDNLDYHIDKPQHYKYGISKTGNYLHGIEFAKRYRTDGVISIPLNPGNLSSDLYREQTGVFKLMIKILTYPCVFGAYTELFAGLSPKITIAESGSWGEFCSVT